MCIYIYIYFTLSYTHMYGKSHDIEPLRRSSCLLDGHIGLTWALQALWKTLSSLRLPHRLATRHEIPAGRAARRNPWSARASRSCDPPGICTSFGLPRCWDVGLFEESAFKLNCKHILLWLGSQIPARSCSTP